MTSTSQRRSVVDSPWDMKMLRIKVAKLIECKYMRCQSCVRRQTVTTPLQDCARFLEGELSRHEFHAVSLNPKYFLKDESLRKSLNDQKEPSWDFLIAHSPTENVSLNMFIRRRNEDRKHRAEELKLELERKRKSLSFAERKTVPKSASIGRRTIAMIEKREKREIEAKSFIRNLALPDLKAVSPTQDLFHRATRSQSADKLWKQLTDACTESHMRANTAKRSDFKEAILRKNPFQVKSPASQMVDVENKREKRRERVELITENLHEALRQRQLDVSRRKDDIEHKRELDRKRLEMSIAHKDQRRVGMRAIMQKEVRG